MVPEFEEPIMSCRDDLKGNDYSKGLSMLIDKWVIHQGAEKEEALCIYQGHKCRSSSMATPLLSPMQIHAFPQAPFYISSHQTVTCLIHSWYLSGTSSDDPEDRHSVLHIGLLQHLWHNEGPQKYFQGETLCAF